MSFSASISGHVNPGENVDQGAIEQAIAAQLATVVGEIDAAYPDTITGASFGGQFGTVNLLPIPAQPQPDPALVAIATDLRAQADALDQLVAAGQPGALTADAEALRVVANDLDPAGGEPAPEEPSTPEEPPAPAPDAPFVVKVDGEQFSDYLDRLAAHNATATEVIHPLDLTEWTALEVG